MNCLLVMKIKWSLDINTGAVERSEAARARSLAGATVGGADADSSVFYKKFTKTRTGLLNYWSVGPVRSAFYRVPYYDYTYVADAHSVVLCINEGTLCIVVYITVVLPHILGMAIIMYASIS